MIRWTRLYANLSSCFFFKNIFYFVVVTIRCIDCNNVFSAEIFQKKEIISPSAVNMR